MNRILEDKKAIFLFLFPAALMYGVIVLSSIVRSIYLSFFDGIYNVNWAFVGFENYMRLVNDSIFWKSLGVTGRYAIITVTGQISLGLIAALIFTYIFPKIGTYGRTILFFPMLLPSIAVSILFGKMLQLQPVPGLFNQLLGIVGLAEFERAWTTDSTWAILSVSFADIWRGIGFYCVVFYAGLINIPKEINEAASIDGANVLQVTRYILIPLLRPVTVTALLICTNWSIQVFEMPYALTGGGPGRDSYTTSMYMYDSAFRLQSYGYGSAIAVVMFVLSIVLASVLNKQNKLSED